MKPKIASKLYIIGLVVLFITTASLRFINLSYSEFNDDEKKTSIRKWENETNIEFFLRQRKGPMQFLIAQIPRAITSNNTSELALRIPFTLLNIASVFVLYALIFKITKKHVPAFIVSFLYSINGFIVGFGRIAQYQDLNLFLSLLSVYFFALASPVTGTILFSLSFLSHWDAVYYVFPIVWFFIKSGVKTRTILVSIIVGSALILPFFIPYCNQLIKANPGNIEYLNKRVGIGGRDLQSHLFTFELYNPVITLWFYIIGLAVSVIFIKKTAPFVLWFIFNFLVIKFFITVPKTHIYNYVLPLLISSGLGYYYLIQWLKTKSKHLYFLSLLSLGIVLILLYIQSYHIFVDNTKEYPWDAKKILWYKNEPFAYNEVITFGFPHKRGWKEIDKIIDPSCTYITNESKSISQIYVRAKYGYNNSCHYVVAVKRPFVSKLENPTPFPQRKKSSIVYKYTHSGKTLTTVYKIN